MKPLVRERAENSVVQKGYLFGPHRSLNTQGRRRGDSLVRRLQVVNQRVCMNQLSTAEDADYAP